MFAACAGKSHVDVDILGDAAMPNPPGTQTCTPSSCDGNSICLLDQCVVRCQQDRECAAGNRCLRTTQGGGCVRSIQTDCGACSLGGTVCIANECRAQCSFGCAGDQFCRDNACYGTDTNHDPRGGTGSTTSGGGGSTGAGGGGLGGQRDAGVPAAAGWWRFDEGFGSVTADASGHGHQGILVNSPSWRPGITGSALGLDGSSQYVMVASGPILGSFQNFTVEAWVNWSGMPGLQTIYGEGGTSDNIDLYLDVGTPIFAILTTNNSVGSIRSSRTLSPGAWHHVAGVLQAGVGGSVYVDGQMASSNPMMGPANQSTFETDIGRVSGAGGSRYFNGIVDEVRVFSFARSSQEIMSDYMSSLTGGTP